MAENHQPNRSDEPEFFRRVLHHAPTPLLVVDGESRVLYANLAMLRMVGWDDVPDRLALDFLHPEDHADLAASFETIIHSPLARVLGGNIWPETRARIIAANGAVVHVEISGAGGMLDDVVGGMIYSVRPAQTKHLMSRVLDELSQGAPIQQMLSHVCEMIALPPLDLDVAILQSSPDGTFAVVATTSPALAEILRAPLDTFWNDATTTPSRTAIEAMPATAGVALGGLGYQAFWAVRVESPLTPTTLRLLAVSPTRHDPDSGIVDRIKHARQIASAILLRTQTDVLLGHAAAYDTLTGLPNRAAFYQLTDGLDPQSGRAALHLDLDGLAVVNKNLGQAIGDALLAIVADRVRAVCKGSDMIGRIDGDELSIVLVATESEPKVHERALDLAAQIREALSEPIVIAGRPLTMSASIGTAFAEPGVSTGQLLAWADAALRDAKNRGGDRVITFGTSFD